MKIHHSVVESNMGHSLVVYGLIEHLALVFPVTLEPYKELQRLHGLWNIRYFHSNGD